MKLKNYLKEHGLSYADFASQLIRPNGVSYHERSVFAWANDIKMPRKDTLRLISGLTNGEVTANDFLSD